MLGSCAYTECQLVRNEQMRVLERKEQSQECRWKMALGGGRGEDKWNLGALRIRVAVNLIFS